MMKQCTMCGNLKPPTEFYKCRRMKDGLASACKKCVNACYTKSRNKKKAHYNQVRRNREHTNRHKLLEWKAIQKCSYCSEDDPECLDLHHINKEEKDVNVGDVCRYWSWERLTTELKKCIVLCANCHRKVHAGKIDISGISSAW